jgi:hypothetical protein
MHVELCVEDASGKKFLEAILPQLLPEDRVTWRVHGYRGIGRIPSNLQHGGKTPGIDAVIVVVDTDGRNCREFLAELHNVLANIQPAPNVIFRLAIEELEAWYLGDQHAIINAYPAAKRAVLQTYQQDSICGTWEKLADAIIPGGAEKLKSVGWPSAGQAKCEWAARITPHMDPDNNSSPSFRKFRDALRSLVQ